MWLIVTGFVAPLTVKAVKVWIPVYTAPDACACIFTLPPESLTAVASIPVKFAPLPTKLVAVIIPDELIFLAVISPVVIWSDAANTTFPVLPYKPVTPPVVDPAKPICLTWISSPSAGADVNTRIDPTIE